MAGSFSAAKGTFDVLPGRDAAWRSELWRAAADGLTAPARRAGYGYVETPVFEDTGLFARGVGTSTDVVSKEMYTFDDRGGRSLTLRPENTAGVVRAVLEHGLERGPLPVKLWYAGPMFRYERPQAGRYRQFFQVGVEGIGVDDPALDAEVVTLGVQAFGEVGLTGVQLLLNSMGDGACRPAYTEALRAYLDAHLGAVDADTSRRIGLNPLRVLDDKRPELQPVIDAAPVLADHLCADCKAHYDAVREHLRDLGVSWVEAPRLVRGLDYYRRTTFEFQSGWLGAQNAVGGGGRYDGLAQDIGGPPLPAVGWALGLDRILLALAAAGVEPALPARCDVFAVPLGDAARRRALVLVTALRDAGVAADLAFGGRGLKGAMKAADRSGARWALVLGERDLAAGVVQLKDLRTGEQSAVPIEDVVTTTARRAQEERPL